MLVILLSFAMPSVGNATARAELKAAAENVQYSIDAARKLARMTESSVAVNIGPTSQANAESAGKSASGAEPQRITFSRPDTALGRPAAEIQDYLLPASVLLVADHDRYVFDARGLVAEPGRVMLHSASDESMSSVIDIK